MPYIKMRLFLVKKMKASLIPLKVCRFICRFSIERLENIRKDYLRDIDGDYHVIDVSIYGQGRNRFLELKARLRGED